MTGTMYEAIKTVVLTSLVLISIMMTFALWTYHPKYDVLQNDEYIQHVSVSNTQVDTEMVVQPKQVLIHKGGAHYALTKEEKKNALHPDNLCKGMVTTTLLKLFKISQVNSSSLFICGFT